MNNGNQEVANEAIKILKERLLIDVENTSIECMLKEGTIKESDWKKVLQIGLSNNTQKNSDETA